MGDAGAAVLALRVAVGDYFTDEARLFRVVEIGEGGVIVEDVMRSRLVVRPIGLDELMGMRRVAPRG